METTVAPPLLSTCQRVSGATGFVLAIVGLVVLSGWLLGIDVLTSVLPGFATMKFNTALGFVLAGASLYAQRRAPAGQPARRVAASCAWLLLALAGLTLLEYAVGRNLGIDELAVRDAGTPASSWPGRMSIGTALDFVVVAAALLLLDVELRTGWRPAQPLALLGALIGGAALLGYVFGVQALYSFALFSSMALHTALLFVVLGAGILLARPERGLMTTVTSAHVGGRLSRLVIPEVLLIPVVLAWLCLRGVALDLYDTDFAFALTTLSSIVILAVLVWLGARSLNLMHEQLERRSRQSAQLAAIVESSADAIIGMNLDGTVTSWNAAAEGLYGFPAAEMVGEPITRIVPQDRIEEEHRILAGIRTGERIEHVETVRLRKDGGRVDLSLIVSPIKNDEGVLVGASKIAHDISARKRAEARFRATVEAAPIGMVMTDSAGAIVLINAEAEKLFGYERSELLGRPVDVLVPERFRDRHPQYRTQFITAPEARRMGAGRDLFGLRKDGSEFPVEIGLSPIGTEEGLFVLSAIVDITERKHADDELRNRTEELLRSNQDLEQFGYVASHDLQEPLRAVSGCVQLLQKRYEGQLDARADEFIAHAVDGAARMQKLIDDLLAYSRVGRADDPFKPTDCDAALDLALENLATALRETGAEVSRGALPTVRAIPAQLTLLFQNLVGNAVKFRRKGDTVRIHVSASRRGDEWDLSVKDNGIGIDAQYFERIFLIFQRLHTRREYPGTGLGLALCKRIVENHGGHIWVESALGEGTTVVFTLHEWHG